jgi:hypothetical protein
MSQLGQQRPICDVRAMSAYAPTPDVMRKRSDRLRRISNGLVRCKKQPSFIENALGFVLFSVSTHEADWGVRVRIFYLFFTWVGSWHPVCRIPHQGICMIVDHGHLIPVPSCTMGQRARWLCRRWIGLRNVGHVVCRTRHMNCDLARSRSQRPAILTLLFSRA